VIFTENVKGGDIMESSPEVAKTLARDVKVIVQHSGDTAYVTENVINLPVYDANAVFNAREAGVNRGYLDHEVAHKKRTDETAWKTWSERNKILKDGHLVQELGNIIEDLRIDGAEMKDTITGHAYMQHAAALEQTHKSQLIKSLTGKEEWSNPRAALPFAIQLLGYKRLGLYDIAFPDLDGKAALALEGKLPADIKEWADKVVDTIQTLAPDHSGTQPGLDIARSILGDIEDEEKKKAGGMSMPAPAGGRGKNKLMEGGPKTIMTDKDLSNMMGHHIKAGDRKAYRPFATAQDSVISLRGDGAHNEYARQLVEEMRKRDIAEYNQIKAKIGNIVHQLKLRLERALVAKSQIDWTSGREKGRLDARLLPQVPIGNTRVFKMPDEDISVNAAVSMLLDCSGSMSGAKMMLATQTAIALTEALDRSGVPVEVLGWHNGSLDGDLANQLRQVMGDARHDARIRFSRLNPQMLFEFKGFNTALRSAMSSLAMAAHAAGGDNADGDAVMSTWRRLRVRPEARRILLVLSDGRPSSMSLNSDDDHLGQYLRNVVQDITKAGAEIIGVGIKDQSVKKYYPRYVVLDDIGELPKTVIGMIADLLLNKRSVKLDNSELFAVNNRVA
jgi:hypothetical protein